jgi:single-strand DNA-binding protein
MNSIQISGVISSSIQYEYNDANELKSAYFMLAVDMPQKEGTTQVELPITCNGSYAAGSLKNIPDSGWVIVSGQGQINRETEYKLGIYASEVHPATLGSSINSISLIGRLGKEPEVMRFEHAMVAKFSLAVNCTKDVTDWFNVETWGKSAEIAEKYVSKGNNLGVTGKLKYEVYQKQDGEDGFIWRVNASRITLIERKNASQSEPAKQDYSFDDDF